MERVIPNNSSTASRKDWQLIEQENIKYFQFKWKNYLAIYSTKYGENEFLRKFEPVFLKQIHSDIIINLDSSDNRTGDGLILQKRNFVPGLKIADCLPVYLFNDKKVCIIHCGWKSIIKGIVKRAGELMGDYKYCLGASIGPCCYEVKQDVVELFNKKYKNAIILKAQEYFLDLKSAVIEDLGNKDLLASLDLCTKCHPEYFYSYRRGDDKKRNYAVIITRI